MFGDNIMFKKAVVDIDNTLWQFCDVLYEELKGINSSMPSPDYWIDWDFWINYCSEKEFWSAIHHIQMNQDDNNYLPYSEAKDFLKKLKEHNYHIVIASHRKPESLTSTKNWLIKHNLVFDEIHLSSDKSELFDKACHIVVDDSPNVLEKAIEKGILNAGLRFAWNRNNGYKLFNDLKEVSDYIRSSNII
jgi:FMN phosphatase YigB (HAD superfamily)